MKIIPISYVIDAARKAGSNYFTFTEMAKCRTRVAKNAYLNEETGAMSFVASYKPKGCARYYEAKVCKNGYLSPTMGTYTTSGPAKREALRLAKETSETLVVFRKWKKPHCTGGYNDILALFPAVPETRGNCLSYARIGQHGGADYHGCIANSVPAAPAEYASLKKELESEPYNYKLKVITRFTRSMAK